MTKVIIVGGVAGGASCAARLRRLDEQAEIVMVERGPYVSFANCGLPYHVGGVIEHESDLLVASPELFRGHFRVDCRTGCEAIGISAQEKTVELKDLATGEVTTESYDKLVLSPGAASIRPPLPGIDLPGIFPVRTVPDAREIREWIERGTSFLTGMGKYSGFQTVRPPMRAVVIGGGFIGLETAENLVFRGFDVTVVEMADQVLTPLDPEYGRLVGDFLEGHGVHVALGDGVAGFEQSEDDSLTVSTQAGKRYPADVVILALGVRPDTTLARMAGIEIGERGGIRVDEHMRTSDPDIFAVGDAVEVRDFVTGEWSLIALAGPANRQARIAAEVITGRDSRFRGTQGTAVVGLFGSTVAWTGANEKTLQRLGDSDFEKVYLYPNSHAGYYPGAKPIAMKVLFRKSDGRVLGAQAVGEDGVDKRISEIALAIQLEATVYDLEECELCYAPPFGSAKDPINFAGMVAAGVLRGDMPVTHWDLSARWIPARRPRERGARRGAGARGGPHPLGRAAITARRAAPRPRDRCHLPLGSARLLRHADPVAERVRRQSHLRRHALARDPRASPEAGDPRVSARMTDQTTTRPVGSSAIACTIEQTLLGEGARWDARRNELLRVDILAGRVYRDRIDDDGSLVPVRTYTVPGTVGAIAPIEGDDGWLLAAGRGFVHLRADGSTRTLTEVAPPGTRMNDGACDPQGRFWAGTLADDHHPGGGALYRLERSGATELMLSDLTIPNGLGWSPDGTTMYLVDSGPRTLSAFDVRPDQRDDLRSASARDRRRAARSTRRNDRRRRRRPMACDLRRRANPPLLTRRRTTPSRDHPS